MLATFIFLVKDEVEAVGFLTAIMGIAQLITSFPSGVLADRHRRDSLLKVASGVGMMAIVATIGACYQQSYVFLAAALSIWGCFWGIANTSISALFADSIHDGDRSFYFTRRFILITVGNTVGPLVSLMLFACLGDEWTVHDCAIVMSIGQIVCFPAVILLCFFNDDDIPQAPSTQSDPLIPPIAETTEPDSDGETSTGVTPDPESRVCPFIAPHRVIPVLVTTADLLSGLGSGMSIRYFPIFFVDSLHLSPIAVQVLYVVAPMFQASFMTLGQHLSKRIGRCAVSVYLKWIGICLMFGMIASYSLGAPRWLVCTFYILRTGSMNSTGALTRSVLMDNVPKEERGKWSALESVNMFSWSGSACIGGILIGFVGILPLFAVTAAIQFFATLPLLVLAGRDREHTEEDSGEGES